MQTNNSEGQTAAATISKIQRKEGLCTWQVQPRPPCSGEQGHRHCPTALCQPAASEKWFKKDKPGVSGAGKVECGTSVTQRAGQASEEEGGKICVRSEPHSRHRHWTVRKLWKSRCLWAFSKVFGKGHQQELVNKQVPVSSQMSFIAHHQRFTKRYCMEHGKMPFMCFGWHDKGCASANPGSLPALC